jgi:putative membrane protein
MILQSLAGLPAFLVYFCTGLVAVVAYLFVYTRVTVHNEFQLIRDNDPAAAIALGLSLLASCCRWSAPLPMPPMSWIA